MAAQFIGLHMRVILRDPPGQQVTGTVRDVEAGLGLTLTNVFVAATKDRFPQMRIDAVNIADLSEATSDEAPVPAPPQPPPQPAFVDPAIVSLGKRPNSTSSGTHSMSERTVAVPEIKKPVPEAIYVEHAGRQTGAQHEEETIVEGLRNVVIEEHEVHNAEVEIAKEPRLQKKRIRTRNSRSQGGRRQAGSNSQTQPVEAEQGGHGKGWRQTPILESTASFQPFHSLRRMGKKAKTTSMDNGWASEDITEEMGEFDFANNLAKFDKRTIFDQMRKDDKLDESSRLVSHNRRAKPGTAGGKNLHYTENVLDMAPGTGAAAAAGADFWNSEAEVHLNGGEKNSGREGNARRGESKGGSARRSQVGSQPLSRVNSSVRYHTWRRSGRRSRQRSTDEEQQGRRQPGLYLHPSMRRLETISSLQMLNVENIAANEVGFSESLMAENAGRGIAEVAVSALSDPAIKVRFQMGGSGDAGVGSSTIVILAGNNKSSIRALAAARHLRNRNFDVVVCLVGIERERDLLEDLRRQIQLYRNFGGKVLGKNDFFECLRKGTPSGPGLSISLIVDALLGLTMSFEELRIGDQASVYELMEWANRNEAFVLAVDVPSGIDATSGKVAVIDGSHLFVKPRYVVAIGAPKKGLLEAVAPDAQSSESSSTHEDEWRMYIADLGLGSAIWKKAGTKIRRGIEFEGKWVMEMRYRGSDESESE